MQQILVSIAENISDIDLKAKAICVSNDNLETNLHELIHLMNSESLKRKRNRDGEEQFQQKQKRLRLSIENMQAELKAAMSAITPVKAMQI